jgi:ribulose-5-phosphate 4-epimerase/fuculose-1-phosphate aldolase
MSEGKNSSEIKEALVSGGRYLDHKGLTPGTTGNLSVIADGRLYCTPTGSNLGRLMAQEISELDLAGNHLGGLKPTKEVKMHLAIYNASDSVNAIVHLHSTYSTAVSCLVPQNPNNCIPALTPYLTMKAGDVSLIPYFAPGDELICEPIVKRINTGTRVMLLANHGNIIASTSLSNSITIAEELEEACKVQVFTSALNPRTLSLAEIALLKNRYPN